MALASPNEAMRMKILLCSTCLYTSTWRFFKSAATAISIHPPHLSGDFIIVQSAEVVGWRGVAGGVAEAVAGGMAEGVAGGMAETMVGGTVRAVVGRIAEGVVGSGGWDGERLWRVGWWRRWWVGWQKWWWVGLLRVRHAGQLR